MSKINNKNILIEKKIELKGKVSCIIADACYEMSKFIQRCEDIQEKEFEEVELLGFGVYKSADDPKNIHRVFINFSTYNNFKKYFEGENYEDISIKITDIPNDFTVIEESKNETE